MDKHPLNLNLLRAARAYAALHAQCPPQARILGNMAIRVSNLEEWQTEALRAAIQRAWGRDDIGEMGEFLRGVR